jgi:two-component system, NarL family, invasion response regulator UvrY
MTRILIVDDHAVVRRGLRNILSEQPDMEVVGEAGNVDELMAFISKNECDIIILDISLPGKSGIDIMKDLRVQYPKLPVLFLSMLPEEQFALRAMKSGASGYLSKGSPTEELVKAIRKIIAGKKYVSQEFAEQLAMGFDPKDERLPHELLSEREFQVLRKLASGKALSQIGAELFLSVKTVATYRARLLEKMNMQSNAELVRYAIEHKLIE